MDKFKLLAADLGDLRIKKDVDLTDYLQSGLGGPAEFFYIATTIRELEKAVKAARDLKLPTLIIGSGSKVAIAKSGILGLIIKNRTEHIRLFGIKGKVSKFGLGIEEALVEADSGISLTKLAEYTKTQGLTGLESLQNLKGTIGGSFQMNPTLNTFASQLKILTPKGQITDVKPQERDKNDIILSIIFKLYAKK